MRGLFCVCFPLHSRRNFNSLEAPIGVEKPCEMGKNPYFPHLTRTRTLVRWVETRTGKVSYEMGKNSYFPHLTRTHTLVRWVKTRTDLLLPLDPRARHVSSAISRTHGD